MTASTGPSHAHEPARDLAEVLENIGGRDGRLLHVTRTPAREGKQGAWPTWADAQLVSAYARRGIHQPWLHQVDAAEALHSGQHTVISTGTGSGKSMAAWLPIVSDIVTADRDNASARRISEHGRRPAALYICPTKALAADQTHSLEQLLAALESVQIREEEEAELRAAETPTHHPRVRVGTCDGDTPLAERDWIRAHADIVLTNPDFLHFSLLPGWERWTRLLRSLRYLVIDECHAYRGVLGAHVSLVIRRLLRLVRRLRPEGPEVTVLCASATAADPALTAARLIGVEPEDVHVVDQDSSPAGERTMILWQPALRDPWAIAETELAALREATEGVTQPDADASPSGGSDSERGDDPPAGHDLDDDPMARRSAVVEAAEVLVDLMSVGARALVFVRSRRSAEIVAEHTRQTLSLAQPELMRSVRAYRGGYLPEERRALEEDLRTGRLRALATTNALELGIDISGLDAVIIAGWPGTRMSLGQQAGRAGRAGTRGVAVLIASDNPLDAYLVRHPEDISAPPEATVFDPNNPYVLAPHLCAAAAESPLRPEELELFGLPDESFLEDLAVRGALRRRPSGWFWNTAIPGRAQDLTSLRGGEAPTLPVVEASTGTIIGTVPGEDVDATVHEGAVYVHQGRTYQVDELTPEAAVVSERPGIGYRTRPREQSSVRILSQREQQQWGNGMTWNFGSVEVTNQVIGYTIHAMPAMEVVAQHGLSMPEHQLPTSAVWWTIPPDVTEATGLDAGELPGALHAAEHASIGLLPLLATCDRWDIGGLSTAMHPQTMAPTVFVHDGHPGGSGFAERGFETARQWLSATLSAIEECSCSDGCPSCVQSPKCGNNNEPLSKSGAIILLRLLLGAMP